MRVKLKSQEEIKKMVREGKVSLWDSSDSGERTVYGVPLSGETVKTDEMGLSGPVVTMPVWFDDYGKEYLVVDHPSPISKEWFERVKILFEEE